MQLHLEQVAILSLIVYRLARVFTRETGPLRIFELTRTVFDRGFLGELLHCPYCLGIWLSALVCIPFYETWYFYVLTVFAVAGGQVILQSIEDNQNG